MSATEITKIEFRKGNEIKIITSKDNDNIKQILEFLQNIKYKKISKEPENGWNYLIQMYDKTGKIENRIAFSFVPTAITFNNKSECYKCDEEIFKGIATLYSSIGETISIMHSGSFKNCPLLTLNSKTCCFL